MRPPQQGHSSTSFASTLSISSADALRDDVDARISQDLRTASGAFGTIRFRHAVFGASVPWHLSK